MKQFFLILSGLALLTGCSSKNDSVEGPVQSRIRIAPSISRVTGLNFIIGKTKCDGIQNQMRLFGGRVSPKRKATKISHTHTKKHRSNGF